MSLASGFGYGTNSGLEAEADLRRKLFSGQKYARSHLLLQDFALFGISDASDKTSHVGAFTSGGHPMLHKVAVHVRGVDYMSHCNTRCEVGGAK